MCESSTFPVNIALQSYSWVIELEINTVEVDGVPDNVTDPSVLTVSVTPSLELFVNLQLESNPNRPLIKFDFKLEKSVEKTTTSRVKIRYL